TMELGSNSGVIVMDDGDWELAARKVSAAGYALAGQVCISVQRVYVHDSHFEAFVKLLKSLVTALKVGNQLEEDTDVGPMISEAEAIVKAGWIEEAVAGGAKLVCGGGRERALLEPAILTNVDPRAKVSCKEVFAPVVCVSPIGSLEEGIERLNDSDYGLQGAIFTRRLKDAMTAARRVEVGGFMINEVPTFRADLMPYGGVKKSGLGREGARYAIEEMTEIRLVCMDLR
ncbi:MAG TPA: aldehyde dehydrogenase family protein, partial [Acidobacteriota bacterium]|nr:aldehyde dehydrogenase family protein [Acidobacteriota bacterium]